MKHLVARCPSRPFRCRVTAHRLWSRLRVRWPDALACVLMGNHLHLLAPGPGPETLRRILAKVPGDTVFEVKSEPVLGNPRSVVRYIVRNPVAADLETSVYPWVWCTWRGSVGAQVYPWVPPERLVAATGHSMRRLERYVATGRLHSEPPRMPIPEPTAIARHPLESVIVASLLATRSPRSALTTRSVARRVFLQTARAEGWTNVQQLRAIAECSRQTVHNAWNAPFIAQPARQVLADSRLLRMGLP